jgi:beta-lactamase regulating signal transducer with metallopeptidase domain
MTALFEYTIRMSVILSVALLGSRLIRRQSAALRHFVLASAMFFTALLPIANRALPSLDWRAPRIDMAALPAPIARVVQETIVAPTPAPEVPAITAPAVQVPAVASGIVATPPPLLADVAPLPVPSVSLADIAGIVYSAGVLISFGVLLLCLARLAGIEFRATTVNDATWTRLAAEISAQYGLRRAPKLLESRLPSVLATWGVFGPRIVIPAGATTWTEERIRVVLGHELAHVCRRDWIVQLSAAVFRALFWFNPLVWMIDRRLRQESEHACDDAVLNCGVAPSDYAAHLLDLARVLGSAQPAWAPALLMARPSTLEQRFEAMLNPRIKRGRVSRLSLILILGMSAGIALPVAVLRAVPQTHEAESYVRAKAASAATTVQSAVLAILQPQITPSTPPAPNSIEGMVVRLGSNEPVSEVDVELRRVEGTATAPLGPLVIPPGNFSPGIQVRPTYPNPADIAHVRTKADGKFVFANLKPGTYRLQAARSGGAYYPAEYGQRSPKGKGYDFQFVEGQAMRDVRLAMAPTGSITGRILDADGKPAARVRVMALEATYPAGERRLGIIQAVQSDDKGEYRLFWLPPGQYVIAARPEDPRRQTLQLFIAPPGSSDGRETFPQAPIVLRSLGDGTVIEETFEVVYYGGGTDVKNARSVDLIAGRTVAGIDLSLAGSRVRTRHVRGTFVDPRGARVPGITVSALPLNSGPSMVTPTAITDANGTFDIPGVGTGAYTIRASLPGFAGFGLVGPGDSDVDGLTLTVGLGFRLQGRIVIDGRASGSGGPDLSKITVRLENAMAGLPATSGGIVNGDAFTVNVPQAGNYRVYVSPLLVPYTPDPNFRPAIPAELQNAYVKTIRLNADDGLNGTVNVTAQPGPLEIVLALNGGALSGVVNERQQPAANSIVVLVPATRSRTDLYRALATGGDGRFRMQGIPPGDYKLFAWDYVENGAWFDAAFMRTHESAGKAVRIAEGNNPEISLTMERP